MQTQTLQNQLIAFQGGYLEEAVRAFLTDRRASGKSPKTVVFYTAMLKHFSDYCASMSLPLVQDVTPDFLRGFILAYGDTHTPGGTHGVYRTIKAFLNWLEAEEVMPDGWKNPIHKVQAPRKSQELLEPVSLDDVSLLVAACKGGNRAERDKAIFLTLLDTGARAGELCALDLADVEFASGTVTVKHGKGDKSRTVFIGRKTRRAVRAYLKTRTDNNPALFVNQFGERLNYTGLRELLRRRAKDAGIPHVTLHAFRRAFAINMLRNGADIFSLQRLLGHADLSVLRRYLAQTDGDLQAAHHKASPVEKLKG
jgi:site-specific recombinase XerD